jgi:hypothetical protein
VCHPTATTRPSRAPWTGGRRPASAPGGAAVATQVRLAAAGRTLCPTHRTSTGRPLWSHRVGRRSVEAADTPPCQFRDAPSHSAQYRGTVYPQRVARFADVSPPDSSRASRGRATDSISPGVSSRIRSDVSRTVGTRPRRQSGPDPPGYPPVLASSTPTNRETQWRCATRARDDWRSTNKRLIGAVSNTKLAWRTRREFHHYPPPSRHRHLTTAGSAVTNRLVTSVFFDVARTAPRPQSHGERRIENP